MSGAKISAMLRVIYLNMPTSSRKLSHGAEKLSRIRLSCKECQQLTSLLSESCTECHCIRSTEDCPGILRICDRDFRL